MGRYQIVFREIWFDSATRRKSFNHFFFRSIPFIIQEHMPLYFGNGRYAVEMQNPIFHPPCIEGDGRPVYPMECTEQSRSYQSELSVDITVRDLVEDLTRFARRSLARFITSYGRVCIFAT